MFVGVFRSYSRLRNLMQTTFCPWPLKAVSVKHHGVQRSKRKRICHYIIGNWTKWNHSASSHRWFTHCFLWNYVLTYRDDFVDMFSIRNFDLPWLAGATGLIYIIYFDWHVDRCIGYINIKTSRASILLRQKHQILSWFFLWRGNIRNSQNLRNAVGLIWMKMADRKWNWKLQHQL